jgi:zinc transport system permease protein
MIDWSTLGDLLALPSVQRSAVALLVGGLFLPIIGVLIIGMDILTVRFAVMHIALLGIAIGLWVGIDPLAVALVLCIVTGGSIAPLAGRPGGLSGPMGFLMTVSIAAALLILAISGVNANGAFTLLWGSILATTPADLYLLIGTAIAVLGVFLYRRRSIALLLFDREIASCSGINLAILTTAILIGISISIALSIRITGALLADSLTILPALAARNVAASFTGMIAWAIAFGVSGNLLGLLVALLLDLPPGPVLVLVAGTATFVTYLISKGTSRVHPQTH